MNWSQLLSLNKYGDKEDRLRAQQDESRIGFEVDYDRVTFSSVFRSLQDKTQVIPLSKNDFVHTRLTHSLEVSVVGRSLGRQAGKSILRKHPELEEQGYKMEDFGSIVAAACLAHDIGNPPFGHAGEKAIAQYFSSGNGKNFKAELTDAEYQDLTHFEGNAHGFQLLTKTKHGAQDGLRLTFATLGAFTKYPKASLPEKPTQGASDKKFGFFQSEKQIFATVAQQLGLLEKKNNTLRYHRHPLAFLVEAADDICYSIIDFEDGINLGWIPEEFALNNLDQLIAKTLNRKKYEQLTTKRARVGYLRSVAIGTLIKDMTEIFIENEGAILKGTFDQSLKSQSKFNSDLKNIVDLSVRKIYQSPEVTEKEILGHRVLSSLLDCFAGAIKRKKDGAPSHFDSLILRQYLSEVEYENQETYQWLINLCSFVAGLSDGQAHRIFHKIKGSEY